MKSRTLVLVVSIGAAAVITGYIGMMGMIGNTPTGSEQTSAVPQSSASTSTAVGAVSDTRPTTTIQSAAMPFVGTVANIDRSGIEVSSDLGPKSCAYSTSTLFWKIVTGASALKKGDVMAVDKDPGTDKQISAVAVEDMSLADFSRSISSASHAIIGQVTGISGTEAVLSTASGEQKINLSSLPLGVTVWTKGSASNIEQGARIQPFCASGGAISLAVYK